LNNNSIEKYIFDRLAVTSRPILVVLNKVDLLRGDYAVGELKEEIAENASVGTYDGNNIRTPEAKLSFKKKLLQRKRDALLITENENVIAAEESVSTDVKHDDTENEESSGDDSGISGSGSKKDVKEFTGNTDYQEYKDEYNEAESENVR
jgi:50S ribosomal subunit-associated GTPase HflX